MRVEPRPGLLQGDFPLDVGPGGALVFDVPEAARRTGEHARVFTVDWRA